MKIFGLRRNVCACSTPTAVRVIVNLSTDANPKSCDEGGASGKQKFHHVNG